MLLSATVLTELSTLAHFLVWEYILKYKGYLGSRRFASILINGQYRFSMICVWRKPCYRCWYLECVLSSLGAGNGEAFRNDSVAATIDMPFIRCTWELSYVLRLPAIIVCYADLCDGELTTHSLNFGVLQRVPDRYDLLRKL